LPPRKPSRPSPRPAKQENGVKQPAQTTDSAQPEKPPEKKKKLVRRGGILVAPLPISSPAIGSGIVPVLAYIFPFSLKDEVSPPSVLGVAGLVTDNGSRGFAIGGQLYLKENTYQITSGFGRGNVNYDIYGNGVVSSLK
jgi:hypothetical protein